MLLYHTSSARRRCSSVSRVTAALLLSFLTSTATPVTANVAPPSAHDHPFSEELVLPPGFAPPSGSHHVEPAEHIFTLKHIYHHGTHQHPGLHRKRDVTESDIEIFLADDESDKNDHVFPTLRVKSHGGPLQRLVDRRPSVVDPMVTEARQRGFAAVLDASAWTVDQVPTPNVTDKDTVLSLAYMTANAYVQEEGQPDWEDVGAPFNRSQDFGWEGDGLRGHIWADQNNSTIVIGLKGTSTAVFDGEETTTNDKENDNLFFSCCCAQQGQWTWRKVCDCATGTYSCNNTCVVQALREEHRYYAAARELYSNVTELYPRSSIWVVGHSLGGAVSSLLGLTYGLPVVTFEAVPEALAASRLGLPVPPGADPKHPQTWEDTGVYHFGHTADPVYIGTCNGATASCSFAGYAMESACHTGKECVYDVVADLGWRVGIGTHKIVSVIKDVLLKYDDVPECRSEPECRDCAQWKMYESNGTETTTTTTSPTTTSRIRTRTETCKTPGWWGCLDKTSTATTTTTTTTTTSTTTTSTSTCKTPGWFGCRDETATTAETTTAEAAPTTTASTTCETPGHFWGCYDQTTTTETPSAGSSEQPPKTTAPPTEPKPTATSFLPRPGKCVSRGWFGQCKERQHQDEAEPFSPKDL